MNPLDYPLSSQPMLDQDKAVNINISAFRLLYIYLLLCQVGRFSFEKLNAHLWKHPYIQRMLSQDTLNKYVHTLQLLGCQISRQENTNQLEYCLDEHPFKVESSAEELDALQAMSNLLASQPVMSTSKLFAALLKRTLKTQNQASLDLNGPLSFFSNHLISPDEARQVEKFLKYCQEGQVLELTCLENEQEPIFRFLEPEKLVAHKKYLSLVGNDPQTNKKVRYPLKNIISHRQLPNRIRAQSVKITVSFKLSGKMARHYVPYYGESITDKGEFLLVKHTTDELSILLRRLLKYGNACQIIAPQSARDEMLYLINQLDEAIQVPQAETDSLEQLQLLNFKPVPLQPLHIPN